MVGQRIDWIRPEGDGNLKDPIDRFRIGRSVGEFGTFVRLAEIPAKDINDDFVLTYEDRTAKDFPLSWYDVQYISKSGQVVSRTLPMRGQVTRASLLQMMYTLRHRIGDNKPPYCLEDWELLDILHEAMVTHNRFVTFETLPEHEFYLVIWLALWRICLMLATDNAKFYPLSVDGATVDKSQRRISYTELAATYKENYTVKRDEWNTDADKSGYIKEGFLTRTSSTTGRRVPHGQTLVPEPVRLFPPERISAGSVTLRWDRSFNPDFYYYIIFRSEAANVQKTIIEDAFHKRVVLFDDPGDVTNGPLWGGITTPLRLLFRNSVTLFIDSNSGLLSRPNFQGPIPLLLPGHTYHYVIGLVDRNILTGISNEVSVTLPELAPPELLIPPTEVEKRVTGRAEPDARVELFRKRSPSPTFTSLGTVQALSGSTPTYTFQDIDIVENDEIKLNQTFLDILSEFTPVSTVTAR